MARFKVLIFAVLVLLCMPAMAQKRFGVSDSVARARAVEYYYLQARSYLDQDSLDRCFELLEHCHALDPSSLTVMYDLSAFYSMLKKDTLVHDMLKRIVDADPSNFYYSKALVNYYLNANDAGSAVEVFEKLLEHSNSKSQIYKYLYTIYAETGYHSKAVETLEKLERIEGSGENFAYHKVGHYVNMGDSLNAVATLQGLLAESPDDLRYLATLGDTYAAFGNRDKALEIYNRVLEIKSDDIYTLNSLADLYSTIEDDSLYCNTIERLLKCENLLSEHRTNMLVSYVKYRYPKDSAHVSDFMREMSELPFDELGIAGVYSEYLTFIQASPDSIVPVLEKILSFEPDNIRVIVALLEYAIDLNDIEAVYKYSEDAILYCPDILDLYFYKGLSAYMLDNVEESIETYVQGLERRSEDSAPEMVSAVYAQLGGIYYDLDMMSECMQAYDSALVYNDANMNALNNYAYYLAVAGEELERALDMSYRTIVAQPDDITCLDTYMWVLFKLERYEEARAYAEKLLSLLDTASPDVYHHCGDVYAKCGDIEKAVLYWTKAQEAGDYSVILEKKIKSRRYYKDAKYRK